MVIKSKGSIKTLYSGNGARVQERVVRKEKQIIHFVSLFLSLSLSLSLFLSVGVFAVGPVSFRCLSTT